MVYCLSVLYLDLYVLPLVTYVSGTGICYVNPTLVSVVGIFNILNHSHTSITNYI